MRTFEKVILATVLVVGFGVTTPAAYALQCVFEPPSNGDLLLGDDTFANVSDLLPAGSAFNFFGVSYGPGAAGGDIFVNANGTVSFGAGEGGGFFFAHSLSDFGTGLPRIAGFRDDLNTAIGGFGGPGSGAVKAEFQPSPDRLIVTWDGVAQFVNSGSNTFQITLFLGSGQYQIFYDSLTATGPAFANSNVLVGASSGGAAAPFVESDLSARKLTKGTQPGFLAESFTGGTADSFDLDGRCLRGNPTQAGSTPQVHLK